MPIARVSPFRRFLPFGVALTLALAAGSYWLSRDANGATGAAQTVTVGRGAIEDTITALGTLQPVEYVDVGAQVSGQLLKLHVALGDQVEEGQLLAEIDPRVSEAKVLASEAQLNSQRAQFRQAEAELRLARLQMQRQQALFAENATSREALESAEAQLAVRAAAIDALKAQIAQTEAGLEQDRTNLGYTKIYAPLAGTVVSQSAKQGQTLNANQQAPLIVQVADLSRMTVQTQVSEADIGRLRVGMPVYFTTLGQERRWQANLRQILPTPTVTNNVVLYNAEFEVDNPDGRLMTQMSAQVFFVNAQADDVLTVPVSVLQGRGRPDAQGTRHRLTVLEGGKPVEREVLIGLRDRVHAQVLDGLREGEQLLAATATAGPLERPAGAGQSQRRMGPRF